MKAIFKQTLETYLSKYFKPVFNSGKLKFAISPVMVD